MVRFLEEWKKFKCALCPIKNTYARSYGLHQVGHFSLNSGQQWLSKLVLSSVRLGSEILSARRHLRAPTDNSSFLHWWANKCPKAWHIGSKFVVSRGRIDFG